ncbi:type II toxin-antitoxin system CcdA family antitoxin [Caenispirillum bisanense]|uniref:type II toxin-antitoxin system CcdA family antitoxin n=1 Tax=Caenispirillum bisanense TaxID=414052 RepID=UPI0031E2C0A3
MPYDHNAPKAPVKVAVNADLLRQARELELDLAVELERGLQESIRKRQALKAEQERLAPHLQALNDLDRTRGTAIDEFLDY